MKKYISLSLFFIPFIAIAAPPSGNNPFLNATPFAELEAQVAANTANIQANAGNIAVLQEVTTVLRSDLDALSTIVTGIEQRVSNNEIQIQQLHSAVTYNSNMINANLERISELETEIARLSVDVTENADAIALLQSDLAQLKAQIAEEFAILSSELERMHLLLLEEAREISGLRGNLLETQRATNEQIQSLLVQINQLRTQVSSIDATLAEQLAYNLVITDLQSQVQTLNSTTDTLNSQLDMLNASFEGHKHTIMRAAQHAHYKSERRSRTETHSHPETRCDEYTERHWYTLWFEEHTHCDYYTYYRTETHTYYYWVNVFDQYHTHWDPADDLSVSEPVQ
ncbi:MAG: hypothetical protein OEX12_14155 [Gammaproteobacteria bacterium]|nr:hypothetical protein [Gammaproteobacteria bacterium]